MISLSSLSSPQRNVVLHDKGHMKVLAVAGSGKTTTMIARIQYLIDHHGVDPSRILSVMFNVAARDSYKAKLVAIYGKQKAPPVFTFHGLGNTVIKQLIAHGELEKYKLTVSDYDLSALGFECVKPHTSTGKAHKSQVDEFLGFVDLCKADVCPPTEIAKKYEITQKPFYLDAFEQFERVRNQRKVYFHADLIKTPVVAVLSAKDKTLAHKLGHLYDYIIVDEFQDINAIQVELVGLFAGPNTQVTVVGDDDQCIYKWRGADPAFLISKIDTYFGTMEMKTYHLPHVFRYGHQVAMSSYHVVSNNKQRADKIGISALTSVTKLSIDTQKVGQISLIRTIAQWHKKGRRLDEIAILLRLYAHSSVVEMALFRARIPYRIIGSNSFLNRPKLVNFMAHFHAVSNSFFSLPQAQAFDVAMGFLRAQKPLYLSHTHLTLCREILTKNPHHLHKALTAVSSELSSHSPAYMLVLNARTLWEDLTKETTTSIEETFKVINEDFGFMSWLNEYCDEDEFNQVSRAIKDIEEYADFSSMDQLSFGCHIESMKRGQVDEHVDDFITITSVHRSKGLEWPLVIIPSLEQGVFPFISNQKDKPVDIESERRLFYVAMTRAQEHLLLLAPPSERLRAFFEQGRVGLKKDRYEVGGGSQFLFESNAFLCQAAESLIKDGSLLKEIKSPQKARKYIKYFHENPL